MTKLLWLAINLSSIIILPSCSKNQSATQTIEHKIDVDFKNAIVAGFLVKRAREGYFAQGYYEYMKPWYETIKNAGLPAIVIHDGLPQSFTQQYQTEKIRFVLAEGEQEFEPFEQRFIFIKTFLQNNPQLEQVLLTDINHGGIFIKQDPFIFMQESYKKAPQGTVNLSRLLFVLEETSVINTSKFWQERLEKPEFEMYRNFFAARPQAKSLCVCFWGGQRKMVLDMLSELNQLFTAKAGGKSASGEDMIAFNFLLYGPLKNNMVTLRLPDPDTIQLRVPQVGFEWCMRDAEGLPPILCENKTDCATAGTLSERCNIPFGRK